MYYIVNEILEICVKYIDKQNSEEVVLKLIELIKTGVGIPTKVGIAKYITK